MVFSELDFMKSSSEFWKIIVSVPTGSNLYAQLLQSSENELFKVQIIFWSFLTWILGNPAQIFQNFQFPFSSCQNLVSQLFLSLENDHFEICIKNQSKPLRFAKKLYPAGFLISIGSYLTNWQNLDQLQSIVSSRILNGFQ